MEEVLSKILQRLDTLTEGQAELKSSQDEMKKVQDEMKKAQDEMKCDQLEMRKEIAFYYGSTMKKLDEVKSELMSEINHLANVQKQHQSVLEIINEKQ